MLTKLFLDVSCTNVGLEGALYGYILILNIKSIGYLRLEHGKL